MTSSAFKTEQIQQLSKYIATTEIELFKLIEDGKPEQYQLTGPLYNDDDEKLKPPAMEKYNFPTWENIDEYKLNRLLFPQFTEEAYKIKKDTFEAFCKERNKIKKMFTDYYIAIERYNQLKKF